MIVSVYVESTVIKTGSGGEIGTGSHLLKIMQQESKVKVINLIAIRLKFDFYTQRINQVLHAVLAAVNFLQPGTDFFT